MWTNLTHLSAKMLSDPSIIGVSRVRDIIMPADKRELERWLRSGYLGDQTRHLGAVEEDGDPVQSTLKKLKNSKPTNC